MDLQGYDAYLSGKISDYPLPEEMLQRSLASIKDFRRVLTLTAVGTFQPLTFILPRLSSRGEVA